MYIVSNEYLVTYPQGIVMLWITYPIIGLYPYNYNLMHMAVDNLWITPSYARNARNSSDFLQRDRNTIYQKIDKYPVFYINCY